MNAESTDRSSSEKTRTELLLPAVVFVVIAAMALGAFVVTRGVMRAQEQNLLAERANEVALLLSTSITSIEGPMSVLSFLADSPTTFEMATTPLAPSDVAGVFAANRVNGSFEVTASVGDAPAMGQVLSGQRAEAVERAFETGGLVAARITDDGAVRLFLALGGNRTVVARDALIDPATPAPTSPESPFAGLRLALYAGAERNPASLVLTTEAEVPIPGEVLEVPITMGSDQWTLAVNARTPMIGELARNMPWILLVGGLVTAALATAVTTILARRRAYALALVEKRTQELRQARQAAEQANLSKSEFLSRMSHELRTPLNAVLGFGQILEMGTLEERQRDAVEHILKGGRHLLTLINEVLDISRAETGVLNLSPEAVRASDMIQDSVDLIRPIATQEGIQLGTSHSEDWERHVFADRQRTQQILLNLLSNAVKYNRQRGTVEVFCSTIDDAWLRISVTDTGPGIPSRQLDQLFVPFERLGAEQSDIEGTGIGLALSKRLAEVMGGRLGVESEPAQGSTFWLDLPVVEEPVERYERLHKPDSEEAPPPSTEQLTVLHIEDNLSNLRLVERVVAQRSGVEVIAAMQGRLGLELAQQHQPGLVLLDLHLPDVAGDEVLRQLRDNPATRMIPVVIVSADATSGQIQRLQTAGAADYLTKPINVRQLLDVIDRYTGSSRD